MDNEDYRDLTEKFEGRPNKGPVRTLAANTLASILREMSAFCNTLAEGIEDPAKDLASIPTIIEMRLTKLDSDLKRAEFQTRMLQKAKDFGFA